MRAEWNTAVTGGCMGNWVANGNKVWSWRSLIVSRWGCLAPPKEHIWAMDQSEASRQLARIQREIEERSATKRQNWLRLAREWMPPSERNELLNALLSDDLYLRDLLDRKWALKRFANK